VVVWILLELNKLIQLLKGSQGGKVVRSWNSIPATQVLTPAWVKYHKKPSSVP